MTIKRVFCICAGTLMLAGASLAPAFAEDPLDFVMKWGSQGSGNGQFDYPMGIDVDADGNVYVAEPGNCRIQKFDTNGNFITKWGSCGSADSLFSGLEDIAIDSNGVVYLVGGGGTRYSVKRYSSSGRFLGWWEWIDQFAGSPEGIAIDPNGFVYVLLDGVIRKTTGDGTFVTSWSSPSSATGIAVDATGAVYVSTQSQIAKFDASGVLVTSWNTPGTAVATDKDGNVYVAQDARSNGIHKFTSTGVFRTNWAPWGSGDGQINNPRGIAVDSHGNVYVAEGGNHRVQKFAHLNYVGVFGDGAGTIDCIRIPQGRSTLHVLAFTGPVTAGGITGAEFRIEVTNPAGYDFQYNPPSGGFSSGSALDVTPDDPEDHTGTTILFSNCQPPGSPRASGDRINLGTITVYNYGGGPTDLVVTRKNPPDDAAMPYPRFLLCDAPFFTPVRMSMSEGLDITSRSRMNSVCCEPRPGAPTGLTATLRATTPQSVLLEWQAPLTGWTVAYNLYRNGNVERLDTQPILGTSYVYVPASGACYRVTAVDSIGREGPFSNQACAMPFGLETKYLDTREASNDGAAGPVSSDQILESRYQYLITVQGTFSLWPSTDWTASTTVLCGRPERAPQSFSGGAVNGWVGVDPEIIFSVPLVQGGDCSALPSLGYPQHPGRFMMDLGSGPRHVEPMGGTPGDFAPEHRYVYLVRGQDEYARFSWMDSLTSDNYGVLTMTVEMVEPTDAAAIELLPVRRLTMLSSVPEPFNPTTEIRYSLPAQSHVLVAVYDVRGRLIRKLFEGAQPGGLRTLRWDGRFDDGSRAGSGVYYVRVMTPHETGSGRVTLVK